MQRITISIDTALADALDEMAAARSYQSRSEAVRDLVRESIERWREDSDAKGPCVANFCYVYDRQIRDLPQRISDIQHEAHDLIVSSMVLRLDHFNVLETLVLKGVRERVVAFADRIRAERGVCLPTFSSIRVEVGDKHESPAHDHLGRHLHLTPTL